MSNPEIRSRTFIGNEHDARDQFAAAALQGLLAKTGTQFDESELADRAFKIAEAMLLRRRS